MSKYHKIQSIFKRDQKTGKFLDEYSCPEFELLAGVPWDWSEKIDGTNIRITLRAAARSPVHTQYTKPVREISGRTDRAQIPAHLLTRLEELFPVEKLEEVFQRPKLQDEGVVLYGEGVGPKIQAGGGRYRSEPDFILFDVRIGRWWLTRENVDRIAGALGLSTAPKVGEGTLHEAIELTKAGFASWTSYDTTLPAEGLVLRPKCELFMRNGGRIITKVKTKDFRDE